MDDDDDFIQDIEDDGDEDDETFDGDAFSEKYARFAIEKEERRTRPGSAPRLSSPTSADQRKRSAEKARQEEAGVTPDILAPRVDFVPPDRPPSRPSSARGVSFAALPPPSAMMAASGGGNFNSSPRSMSPLGGSSKWSAASSAGAIKADTIAREAEAELRLRMGSLAGGVNAEEYAMAQMERDSAGDAPPPRGGRAGGGALSNAGMLGLGAKTRGYKPKTGKVVYGEGVDDPVYRMEPPARSKPPLPKTSRKKTKKKAGGAGGGAGAERPGTAPSARAWGGRVDSSKATYTALLGDYQRKMTMSPAEERRARELANLTTDWRAALEGDVLRKVAEANQYARLLRLTARYRGNVRDRAEIRVEVYEHVPGGGGGSKFGTPPTPVRDLGVDAFLKTHARLQRQVDSSAGPQDKLGAAVGAGGGASAGGGGLVPAPIKKRAGAGAGAGAGSFEAPGASVGVEMGRDAEQRELVRESTHDALRSCASLCRRLSVQIGILEAVGSLSAFQPAAEA